MNIENLGFVDDFGNYPNNKDLRIDTFASNGAAHGMRITHVPTGISVTGTRAPQQSQYNLKLQLIHEIIDEFTKIDYKVIRE